MLVIDCRGLSCPQPVLKVRQALKTAKLPLEILVDNPVAGNNIARLLDTNQCAYTRKSLDKTIKFVVSGGTLQEQVGTGIVWIINADTLGGGDPQLGLALVKSLLHTIAEAKEVTTIFFLNAGVRLCAGPNALTQHLDALVEAGVDLACCGTCLDYYQLNDQLYAGRVTSMYEIVEQMQLAGRVFSI